ncbi:MAG TPA: hypothetical protein VGF30_00255 [Bacteroidia bacterium]
MKSRELDICKATIRKLELDLSDLTVCTECASGPYAYTPVMALMAGAKKVLSVGRSTSYGTFEENSEKIKALCTAAGLDAGKISFIEKSQLHSDHLQEVNILTNSGMLRPVKEEVIRSLPSFAVIPLMWETWEFRSSDLDLPACQKNGIPVIGTNESFPAINMFGYNAFIVMKLLFDLGIEGHNNKVVLLGGGKSGYGAFAGLKNTSIDVLWYTHDGEKGSKTYAELSGLLDQDHVDAIINFEHEHPINVFDGSFGLSFSALAKRFPSIAYGHICGNVDPAALKQSGIHHLPEKILPFGYMSYATENIGPRPVFELCAMGLKVGELAARKRLQNTGIEETIRYTVDAGIGMDFPGGFLNYTA